MDIARKKNKLAAKDAFNSFLNCMTSPHFNNPVLIVNTHLDEYESIIREFCSAQNQEIRRYSFDEGHFKGQKGDGIIGIIRL